MFELRHGTEFMATGIMSIQNCCYCLVAKLCQLFAIMWTVCSIPGFFCPWDFPGKNTEVGCHFLLQDIFLTQILNLHLLLWQADSLPLSHHESSKHTEWGSSAHGILQARILEWVAIPFSRGSSWPRDGTQVSCIAGRFFTIWAIREALVRIRHSNLEAKFKMFN